jgi:hypothetical protein
MSDLTIFPADIAEMSETQLAALPPEQKREVDKNLDEALDWLKKARAKFDAALDKCYGEQARAALRESGRDFGTAHISDGPLHIKFELPKKVSWNQKQLGEIAERIVASGEKVEGYLDIKLSVSESRYTNWPPALQQQFAAARTVDAGNAWRSRTRCKRRSSKRLRNNGNSLNLNSAPRSGRSRPRPRLPFSRRRSTPPR